MFTSEIDNNCILIQLTISKYTSYIITQYKLLPANWNFIDKIVYEIKIICVVQMSVSHDIYMKTGKYVRLHMVILCRAS